jgi:hypothetical protein
MTNEQVSVHKTVNKKNIDQPSVDAKVKFQVTPEATVNNDRKLLTQNQVLSTDAQVRRQNRDNAQIQYETYQNEIVHQHQGISQQQTTR